MLNRLIIGLAEFSRRHALAVALGGLLVAVFAGFYAVTHLSVTTDTDMMFSSSLPWRQQADAMNKAFPQFNNLLVAVIDAREPEEADATAAALADAIAKDHTHFQTVRRPDASPFLRREGLLFLDTKQLSDLMDRTIDAQPFLGQLAADPTARGLFQALSLLGMGVTKGGEDITPYMSSLEGFHQALAEALAGHPKTIIVAVAAGRQRAERPRGPIPLRAGATQARLRRARTGRRGHRCDARHHRQPAVREIG